jgi:hypothetical protein
MGPNEKYFLRARGPWRWTVQFKLISLNGLWRSSIHWTHKIRAVGMLLNQLIFGKFSMWTCVEFEENSLRVKHLLRLTKWGIVFYRSEKRISPDPNGFDLVIDGEEYFWPIISKPEPFKNLKGRVDPSFTSAKYQWPLFGLPSNCETLLGKDQGIIRLDSGWLQSTFQLTSGSMVELNLR